MIVNKSYYQEKEMGMTIQMKKERRKVNNQEKSVSDNNSHV